MRHRTPPRLAVAFLNRFGPNDDGLVGSEMCIRDRLITWIVPEVWWIAGASMLAGAAAGIVLVAANRRRRDTSPWMGTPSLLSRDTVNEDQAASEITADHRQ